MSAPSDMIRVLIVDDSAAIRGALGRIVDAESDMTVVTTAPNGQVALDALRHHDVDVVLLDIEMPEMDGLTALPLILSLYPGTRVIMASSLTMRGAEVTMHALALGASDYITKPAARTGSATLAAVSVEIAGKVRAIGQAARRLRDVAPTRAIPPALAHNGVLSARTGNAPARIVAIAASTGGPNAIADLLAALPPDFPVPIVITQHMPPVFTLLLAQRLERDGRRPCVEAKNGVRVLPNHTYVAPGDHHMLVHTDEGQPCIRLTQTEPENFCRPAADPMLRSVAAIYGASTLAVVLTGMGDDAMRGCAAVRQRGGRVIAQDQASSVVWGMPGAVVNAGHATAVLPLTAIADAIIAACGYSASGVAA